MIDKKICVVGLGYIGLPTAAVLADKSFDVTGVDINEDVVDLINQGRSSIVEPNLDKLLKKVVGSGKLKVYTQQQTADIYLICVPTPFSIVDGAPKPILDHLFSAVSEVANILKPGDLIIIESTIPVGTTEDIYTFLIKKGIDPSFVNIAYCPERVLPGQVLKELVENDRVVGGASEKSTNMAAEFYRSFVTGKVLLTASKTAEMCKLSENAFRDVNIAFANELSLICEQENINVWELIKLTNYHPRVDVLQPSVGVGGHCIAVDPWFIVSKNPDYAKIIRMAREVNSEKTNWVIKNIETKIEDISLQIGRNVKIACLGLAFKPDIDDLRESPALHITETLQSRGHDIIAVEPNIIQYDGIRIVSLDFALDAADLVAVLVRHSQFTEGRTRQKLEECEALDFCGAINIANS